MDVSRSIVAYLKCFRKEKPVYDHIRSRRDDAEMNPIKVRIRISSKDISKWKLILFLCFLVLFQI